MSKSVGLSCGVKKRLQLYDRSNYLLLLLESLVELRKWKGIHTQLHHALSEFPRVPRYRSSVINIIGSQIIWFLNFHIPTTFLSQRDFTDRTARSLSC